MLTLGPPSADWYHCATLAILISFGVAILVWLYWCFSPSFIFLLSQFVKRAFGVGSSDRDQSTDPPPSVRPRPLSREQAGGPERRQLSSVVMQQQVLLIFHTSVLLHVICILFGLPDYTISTYFMLIPTTSQASVHVENLKVAAKGIKAASHVAVCRHTCVIPSSPALAAPLKPSLTALRPCHTFFMMPL